MRAIITILLFSVVLPVLGGNAENVQEQKKQRSEPNPVEKNTLFIDLFNGVTAIPDTTVWQLCGYANNAWSQHFKDVKGYENVKVEDGYLKLKACKDEGVYKNGGIRSKIGFPCNSRLEVKARLTKLVRGGFPAIWQMPIDGAPWPRGGEIDLMEWVQSTPEQIYQTVHTFYINGANGSAGETNLNPEQNFDVTNDHIYAVDRTEDMLIFYVDGKETWRYKNKKLDAELLQYPFCQYMYDIILNFSLGGTLNGASTWPGKIYDEDLPGEMWVDWVRVIALPPTCEVEIANIGN